MDTATLSTDILNNLFPEEKVNEEFRKQLVDIVQHDTEFPTFPAAIAKLQSLLHHPDTGFEEIAEVVKIDPALTAKILSLVRSAAFGGSHISSVEEALLRLGLKETRAAILTSKFMARFSHFDVPIDWGVFWTHSLLTARLTQAISDVFRPFSEREYLTGLLHDVGELILAHYFRENFEEFIKDARHGNTPMFKVEEDTLGIDHSSIGAVLCYKWGLEYEISQAIQFHHHLARAPKEAFLVRCLYVANSVANRIEGNIGSDEDDSETINEISSLPEWEELAAFKPRKMITINLEEERKKAKEAVRFLKSETA